MWNLIGGGAMYKKLAKGDLDLFFQNLKTLGKVYGPVSIGGFSYEFKEVNSIDSINLDYTRTMIPPKKFYVKYATRESLFKFDEEKSVYKESLEEKTVVFGIHPCDLHAVKLLDRVYQDEKPDKYYAKRKENLILIGVDCHPDKYCFCKSTGTSYASDGFDLFLHEISDGYFVRIGSKMGYQIIDVNKSIFKDAGDKDVEEFKSNEKKRLKEFTLELNIFGLQDMLDLSYEDPVWKENADVCFGCGNCNLVCPTCRCYDVVDLVNLDLKSGERVRRWDSCMLKKHALVAGRLNFRPTRVDRLLNRFNCKGSLREGMFNCVGCGRCTVYCPADIDFVDIMKKVNGEL